MARRPRARKKSESARTGRTQTAARGKRSGRKRAAGTRGASGRKWSRAVTERSDALSLESAVFTKGDPRAIALSLRRSAERSRRRKSKPYRSAMSMLSFYVNRAGRKLPAARRRVLERAKDELRRLYGRA